MRVELTPGYILHRREYRDTSYLLDVWTQDFGRLSLVARGMRGPKSRFHGAQIFQRLLLSWSGRGEMGTLSAAEIDGIALTLRGEQALSGFYLNELLTVLVHKHDPNPELFVDYELALTALADICQRDDQCAVTEEQIILRIFEKRLLDALGYGIHFEAVLDSGQRIDPELRYIYDTERGFLHAANGSKHSFLGQSILSYGLEMLDSPETLKDAKRLMRIVLDHHLGGRELKSRKLRIAMAKQKQHIE